jgi:hypothetical protein
VFEDRAAIGYDHGYDAEVFYLGLALDHLIKNLFGYFGSPPEEKVLSPQPVLVAPH